MNPTLTIALAAIATTALAAEDILLADFEHATYAPWHIAGEAFGPGPARGTLPRQMQVTGFKGAGLVNSYFNGDDSIGTLTSPAFLVERKFIAFLIGGGKSDKLALQMLVDDKVVRSETGTNDLPGGSEALSVDSWDVTEFSGKIATLRILDNAKGGWGHINVDHIVQTDVKPKVLVNDAERQFNVTSRYLHIPIKNGASRKKVTLLVAGQPVVSNDIELADAEPDWWAPMDVSAWHGMVLTLRVDKLNDDSNALRVIEQSDVLKDADDLYQETLRGQFHFSAKRGWNNDPNGCVFYNGEYHLFFQHNPYGWGWGNMHWGHAVSKDLVHWDELGDKLLPDDMGPMFSGSAVVDWNNTSGFGKDGKPPLVLLYTAAGNPAVQCIAHSTDGRSFTKYGGNPVLKQITGGNRDPKVMWHEPTRKWVMVLYVTLAGGQHSVHFFTSPNLRDWTQTSITEGTAGTKYLYECPDFFELAVDGDAARKKWVLLGADSAHALGSFDGRRFVPEVTGLPGHRGKGFYAAQSFSDVPDGRRILIGWWGTETRGMPFNQSMTLPLELSLTQTENGPRLTFLPIRELHALRAATHRPDVKALHPGDRNPLEAIRAELVELRAEFVPGDAQLVVFNIRGILVEYDPKREEISVAGHRAPAPLREGKQRLVIYCDRTGAEVFASDGLCYVPMPQNTKVDNRRLVVEARGGTVKFDSFEVHELRSAWPQN